MPQGKVSNRLDGGGFTGKSRSLTVLQGGQKWGTCRSCGSSLYPQRQESVKVRTIGGERLKVAKFRCGCGTGQEVRRAA